MKKSPVVFFWLRACSGTKLASVALSPSEDLFRAVSNALSIIPRISAGSQSSGLEVNVSTSPETVPSMSNMNMIQLITIVILSSLSIQKALDENKTLEKIENNCREYLIHQILRGNGKVLKKDFDFSILIKNVFTLLTELERTNLLDFSMTDNGAIYSSSPVACLSLTLGEMGNGKLLSNMTEKYILKQLC